MDRQDPELINELIAQRRIREQAKADKWREEEAQAKLANAERIAEFADEIMKWRVDNATALSDEQVISLATKCVDVSMRQMATWIISAMTKKVPS